MQRFKALGVVEQTSRHSFDEVSEFFGKLEGVFDYEEFSKAWVVEGVGAEDVGVAVGYRPYRPSALF